MNHTSIEWAQNPDGTPGYSWNPITGCRNHTRGMCNNGGFPCYAYKLANGRVKNVYLANTCLPAHDENDHDNHHRDPFYPRIWPSRSIPRSNNPRGIFVCDMSDLFGIGISTQWTFAVIREIYRHPADRFYLLTKQFRNLTRWRNFPDNCWLGVTATNDQQAYDVDALFSYVNGAVKYLSLEPLLGWLGCPEFRNVNWIIIGACTSANRQELERITDDQSRIMRYGRLWTLQPRVEWVKDIIMAADAAGIPVFLKNNLTPPLEKAGIPLRHDMPEATKIASAQVEGAFLPDHE